MGCKECHIYLSSEGKEAMIQKLRNWKDGAATGIYIALFQYIMYSIPTTAP